MTYVPKARWLNADLTERGRLDDAGIAVDLTTDAVSKATITLPTKDALPAIHDLLELFTAYGSAGIFRVVSYSHSIGQNAILQLMGAMDTLSDNVYEQSADGDVSKAAAAWMNDILGRQKTALWQAGDCELNVSVKLRPNYQSLWTMLENVRKARNGYWWVADYTTTPWTLHLRRMPVTVDAEARIPRNISSAQISVTDDELCNRLYATYTPAQGNSTLSVYENTTSQAAYGIREKCTDIKWTDIPDGMTLAEYAAALMEQHANPTASIQITGVDLHSLTGDAFDRIRLGSLCRAHLPGLPAPLAERVVKLSWPNAREEPENIRYSLSNVIEPITGGLNIMKKVASGMGGGGAGKGVKEPLEGWSMILTKTIEATEGSGILQMWQSGIDMTAEGGVKIFSLEQGYNSLYSGINVQKGRIDLVVEGEGSEAYIKIQAIADDLNGSSVNIKANRITLNGDTTTSGITVSDVMSVTTSNGIIMNKELTLAQSTLSLGLITSEAGFLAEGSNVHAEQYVIADSGYKIGESVLDPITAISLTQPPAGSNDYTLAWTSLNGDHSGSGTFSRAISSFTGTWTGGALDVLASPQAQHYYDWIKGGTASWSGTTATVDIMHSTTPQNEQSFTSTGQRVTVNASSKLETGSASSDGTYYPSGDNIGFSSFTVSGSGGGSIDPSQDIVIGSYNNSPTEPSVGVTANLMRDTILAAQRNHNWFRFKVTINGVSGEKYYKFKFD